MSQKLDNALKHSDENDCPEGRLLAAEVRRLQERVRHLERDTIDFSDNFYQQRNRANKAEAQLSAALEQLRQANIALNEALVRLPVKEGLALLAQVKELEAVIERGDNDVVRILAERDKEREGRLIASADADKWVTENMKSQAERDVLQAKVSALEGAIEAHLQDDRGVCNVVGLEKALEQAEDVK